MVVTPLIPPELSIVFPEFVIEFVVSEVMVVDAIVPPSTLSPEI